MSSLEWVKAGNDGLCQFSLLLKLWVGIKLLYLFISYSGGLNRTITSGELSSSVVIVRITSFSLPTINMLLQRICLVVWDMYWRWSWRKNASLEKIAHFCRWSKEGSWYCSCEWLRLWAIARQNLFLFYYCSILVDGNLSWTVIDSIHQLFYSNIQGMSISNLL